MTSLISWINGLSALTLICFGWAVVIVSIYYYKKQRLNIWKAGMLLGTSIGLGWMGITTTFLSVALFGENLPWVKGIISYFSYSTIPLGALAIIYVSWDVTGSPQSKKYVLGGFILYSILYYYILYTTFDQAVVCPEVPVGEIYDDWITPSSIFYYILWGEVGFAALISVIGFNKLRSAAPGAIKKKSIYIIMATPIVGLSILLDTVILMEWAELLLSIPRFAMCVGITLIVLGLKPLSSK